jgi:hypothetical protein
VVEIRVARNDYPRRQKQWHGFLIREFTTRLCYEPEVFMAEPIFPKTEFEERWARARQRMGRSGLRALVAYSPGNQFWLTGFTGASGARRMSEYSHQLMLPKAVLPLEGEPA